MTNGDRLRQMEDQALAGEMWKFASSEIMKYIDLPKWLAQEEKSYPICGTAATVRLDNGAEYPCTIVGTEKMFDKPYYVLVMREDFPYESRLMRAPATSVTKKD